MAKYKLKSLSVQIAGHLVKKEDNVVFDDIEMESISGEIKAAFKAGFLVKIDDSETKEEDLEIKPENLEIKVEDPETKKSEDLEPVKNENKSHNKKK